MARNRQRAKERQAERRAARQAASDDSGAVPNAQQNFEAPPQELGRSDYTLAHTNEDEEFIGDLELERQATAAGDDGADGDDANGTAAAGPRGVRGGRDRSHEE